MNAGLACGNRFALNRFTPVAFLVVAAVLVLTALPVAASAESSGFGRVADGIEFSLAPVLKEVSAGTAGFQEVDLRNSAGTDLNVAVAAETDSSEALRRGAPADWAAFGQNKFVLLAGEKRVLNLAWSIPQNAVPGDYLVTLSAQDSETGAGIKEANAVHSFLLRVKPAPSQSTPSSPPFYLSESVTADFESGRLLVSLKLDNPSNEKTLGVSIQDFPAAIFAAEDEMSKVSFEGAVGAVEKRGSPATAGSAGGFAGFSVKWVLPDGLQAGESRWFSYSIPLSASDFERVDFARLGEWSSNAVFQPAAQPLLSVTSLKASKAITGKTGGGASGEANAVEASVVEAKVFYAGDETSTSSTSKTLKTLQVTAALEAPGFFSVSPQQTTFALEPRSEKTLFFNVTPSSTTASGAYNLLFTVTSNDASVEATAMKTTLVVVENLAGDEAAAGLAGFWTQLFSAQSGSGYWLALLAILVLLAVAAFIAFGRLNRLKLLRNEEFEDREGFLEQVKRSV